MLLASPKAKANEAMKNNPRFHIAQMSLAQVAACLPPEVEVELADQLVQPIPYDTDADLCGVTVMTEVAEPAYEIADELRRRGKPVVMGGIHATLCPDEVKQHCDTVVIGEAEGVMPEVIDDFRRGRLKPFYRRAAPVEMVGLPTPRRDLFPRGLYRTVNSVQLSRGCPNNCAFCIVPIVHGRRYRLRPLDEVMREIESLEGEELFFSDDNLAGNPQYARELFRRLAPLRRRFIGQLSVNGLKDNELLRLANRAGCTGFFIGLESVSQESLVSVNKRQKVEDFVTGIKRLHDNGMGLVGAFVFGLDSDGPDVFARTVDFVERTPVDIVQFTILTPFPGTPIYETFRQQGRLLHPRWWLDSSWNFVPYRPAGMTREQLRDGWLWALRRVNRVPSILRRLVPLLPKRSLAVNRFALYLNLAYRAGVAPMFAHEPPPLHSEASTAST
jgi:radical SAM superfamily enzyme YgiQ (UPF0313 family)